MITGGGGGGGGGGQTPTLPEKYLCFFQYFARKDGIFARIC